MSQQFLSTDRGFQIEHETLTGVSRWATAHCPNPRCDSTGPTFGVDRLTGKYECQRCHLAGDGFASFFAWKYSIDLKTARREIEKKFGVPARDSEAEFAAQREAAKRDKIAKAKREADEKAAALEDEIRSTKARLAELKATAT